MVEVLRQLLVVLSWLLFIGVLLIVGAEAARSQSLLLGGVVFLFGVFIAVYFGVRLGQRE